MTDRCLVLLGLAAQKEHMELLRQSQGSVLRQDGVITKAVAFYLGERGGTVYQLNAYNGYGSPISAIVVGPCVNGDGSPIEGPGPDFHLPVQRGRDMIAICFENAHHWTTVRPDPLL